MPSNIPQPNWLETKTDTVSIYLQTIIDLAKHQRKKGTLMHNVKHAKIITHPLTTESIPELAM